MRYLGSIFLLFATSFVVVVIDASICARARADSGEVSGDLVWGDRSAGFVGGDHSGSEYRGAGGITVIVVDWPRPCPGDCDGDHSVTVDELITGVAIAMDQIPADACGALLEPVNVASVVTAVSNALYGCPY